MVISVVEGVALWWSAWWRSEFVKEEDSQKRRSKTRSSPPNTDQKSKTTIQASFALQQCKQTKLIFKSKHTGQRNPTPTRPPGRSNRSDPRLPRSERKTRNGFADGDKWTEDRLGICKGVLDWPAVMEQTQTRRIGLGFRFSSNWFLLLLWR